MKKPSIIGLVLAGTIALTYLGDWLVLRYRLARRTGVSTVTVRQYYAIQEKNERTEYVNGPSGDQKCVNSLFAHGGLLPCWYLRRHPEQQVRI